MGPGSAQGNSNHRACLHGTWGRGSWKPLRLPLAFYSPNLPLNSLGLSRFPSLQTLSLVPLAPFQAWPFPNAEPRDVLLSIWEGVRSYVSQAWELDTGRGSRKGLCLPGGDCASPNLQTLLPLSGKHEPALSKVLVEKTEALWASDSPSLITTPPEAARSEDLRLREEDRHFGQSLGYRAENIFLSFFFYKFIYLFNFWLRWVFVAACGLSLVAASGATLRCGAQASHYGGFSCWGARVLGAQASVVVAHGLSSCGSRALERRLSSCGAWA